MAEDRSVRVTHLWTFIVWMSDGNKLDPGFKLNPVFYYSSMDQAYSEAKEYGEGWMKEYNPTNEEPCEILQIQIMMV